MSQEGTIHISQVKQASLMDRFFLGLRNWVDGSSQLKYYGHFREPPKYLERLQFRAISRTHSKGAVNAIPH